MSLEDISVVKDFLNVFPNDLLDLLMSLKLIYF